CVAQDESTSVIYGMPKAIVDNSLADRVLPMQQIPKFINEVA
ncbi:MAG: chemotaxis response regulator protein-glutamate methylesterase, partial [Ignavibacteria bacterium]